MVWLVLACQVASETPSLPAPAAEGTNPFRGVPVGSVPHPTAIVAPPADPAALYVTEQEGRIWRLAGGGTSVVLDVQARIKSGGETGLLGLAFAPDWPSDPRAFVNYTYEAGGALRTRVASFRVDPGTHVADPTSEVEVLSFEQPYSNHNGGGLVFGSDRMLYIGVGDGGSGGDPEGHGQDLGDWLGSILRVDVRTPPYTVPPDNPFVGRPGVKPEIWAYGVRNPWGMSMDGDTLWFADVGQNKWEEVNVGQAGANYGWNRMEGTHCFKSASCDRAGLTLPVGEYGHDVGASVTGGVVYRGKELPALHGAYLYADFATGRFFAVSPPADPVPLGKLALNPSCFGRDSAGTLYVGDYSQGVIFRAEPKQPAVTR